MKDLESLKNHIPKVIGEDELFRSAVCIALIDKGETGRLEDMEILFQVRSNKIPDQPGDICLPGGRIEAGESPKQAAVRELCEEMLVAPGDVEVVAAGDFFPSESLITYTFAVLLKNYKGTFSKDEVSEVFTVPVKFFAEHEPEKYISSYTMNLPEDFPFDRINGGRNYNFRGRTAYHLFYQYEDRCIWGLTAKLIHAFVKMIK